MKGKEAAPLNRRLMAGLIACLLLIVALAVAGGVAFSGVLWYREQDVYKRQERGCTYEQASAF